MTWVIAFSHLPFQYSLYSVNLMISISLSNLFQGHFTHTVVFNTLRSKEYGCYFADGICKCIFIYQNHCIPIQSSLPFVSKDLIDNELSSAEQ